MVVVYDYSMIIIQKEPNYINCFYILLIKNLIQFNFQKDRNNEVVKIICGG